MIEGDSTIEDILATWPALGRVFVRLGLPCFECGEPTWGTVRELCARHGRDQAVVLRVLNEEAGRDETSRAGGSSKA